MRNACQTKTEDRKNAGDRMIDLVINILPVILLLLYLFIPFPF